MSTSSFHRFFHKGLRLVFRLSPPASSPFRKHNLWFLYQFLSSLYHHRDLAFMNYGYAPLDPEESTLPLHVTDEPNRFAIQLYHRVAGAIDLRGKEVLEVGCGRGGGASFVMRYLHPRSFTGVDYASKALAICGRQHRLPGLSFTRADAENLPFLANSVDAVINVESSHCYSSMERFLGEAVRILRPGGSLLFADMRERWCVDVLRQEMRASGMQVVEEERITPNVLRALELDETRKRALVEATAPRLVRPLLLTCWGLPGTTGYEQLRRGEWEYLRFHLRKPG
jgi:ubiquinone/menaquinone biosynthesis C-methylase UbiE